MSYPADKPYPELIVIGITGISEVQVDDDLGTMILDAALAQGTPVQEGDILVVTQKIISKSEGRIIDLSTVTPSAKGIELAQALGKDPRLIELVLRESKIIVRTDLSRGIIITETHHGFICANSGIDSSNIPGDTKVALLPVHPDKSAARLRSHMEQAVGGSLAIIIADTFGRAWREGQVNFAIGMSGIVPIRDYRGSLDTVGKELKVTRIAEADELAAAVELVMSKTAQIPVGIVRGHHLNSGNLGYKSLIRDSSIDLFR